MDILDRAYGALVGGAIGDAMGMPASFLTREQIKNTYGYIEDFLTSSQALKGKHVIVTAGGTRENIDPVRFIGNRSSGKMGIALANAAVQAGAKVTLIAGQVTVPLPQTPAIEVVRVTTTEDLYTTSKERFSPLYQ